MEDMQRNVSRPPCPKHGLAMADDGMCVVCRRGRQDKPPPAPQASNEPLTGLWIIGGVVMAFIVGMLVVLEKRADSVRVLPEDRELAAASDDSEQPQIVVYVTPWCPHCNNAKRWLDESGYDYVEYNVEADARARKELLQINGRGSVPTFKIGDETIVGFDKRRIVAAIDG